MKRDLTIEMCQGKAAVYEHGEYPETSVLAGQYRRAFIDEFDTVEEAAREYPEADVIDYTTGGVRPSLSTIAPDWFDPADAGETW